MIDYEATIFTKVKNAILPLCKNCSTTYVDSPSVFPYVFLTQTDNRGTLYTLSNNENGVETVIEVTSYTTGSGAYNAGKKIHALSDDTMIKMGFQRIFGPQQITNLSNPSITRVIARYRRLICNNDTL